MWSSTARAPTRRWSRPSTPPPRWSWSPTRNWRRCAAPAASPATLRLRCGAERVKLAAQPLRSAVGHQPGDVERVLGGPVKYVFPSDYRTAVAALNRGEPLVVQQPGPAGRGVRRVRARRRRAGGRSRRKRPRPGCSAGWAAGVDSRGKGTVMSLMSTQSRPVATRVGGRPPGELPGPEGAHSPHAAEPVEPRPAEPGRPRAGRAGDPRPDRLAARRREEQHAAQPVRAGNADHRRLQRAVRAGPARGAARRPEISDILVNRADQILHRARRPARSRPTWCSRTTSTCCASSSASSARWAAASTSRARWWTRGWPTVRVSTRSSRRWRSTARCSRSAASAPTSSAAQDLVARQSLTQPMLEFLKAAVGARLNILVSGGTGAGKTTFLNVLSSFISDRERIVTIEDAAELVLRQRHVVRLETRPSNIEGKGAVKQRQLADQCPAHAARSHRRRRGPWRGSARHAAGDEHRPRRQLDDHPRQQPAATRCTASTRWWRWPT